MLRTGYIRSGHMKAQGTNEGVDIVREKNQVGQQTVFKENWRKKTGARGEDVVNPGLGEGLEKARMGQE